MSNIYRVKLLSNYEVDVPVEYVKIVQPNDSFETYYAYTEVKPNEVSHIICVIPCLLADSILKITTNEGTIPAGHVGRLIELCEASFKLAV